MGRDLHEQSSASRPPGELLPQWRKMSRPRTATMIEVDCFPEDHLVKVRFRGNVTSREFADLAAIIADFGSGVAVLVYLDWVGIERWEFTVASANGVTTWRRASQVVGRAAIVHLPRLNRQAAWLAAILRREGVEVRSWRPKDAVAAAIWLRRPSTAAVLP